MERIDGEDPETRVPLELVSKLFREYEGGICCSGGKFYSKKWASTGISKGGEAALIYESKYPNDIDLTVAEVAPIILGREDQRTTDFLSTVGKKYCRQRVACLKYKDTSGTKHEN